MRCEHHRELGSFSHREGVPCGDRLWEIMTSSPVHPSPISKEQLKSQRHIAPFFLT